jgi:hypothetical protein
MHLESRLLTKIPPARLWPAHYKRRWREVCSDFTGELKAALDDGSDLALLQIFLDLLELPLVAFQPLLLEKEQQTAERDSLYCKPPPLIPDPLPNEGGRPEQRAAVKRAREDLWSKAMQNLLSNGAAPSDVKTFAQLDAMHRKRDEPLRPHKPKPGQVQVTTNQAKRFLYKLAAQERTSIDAFGWAADFLFHVRNTPFLRQMGRLTALTASAKVPDSLATVLTCGGLLALHKESPKEQAERRNRGEDPKIRPVNIGCCLLKWAFKLALLSKPAQQAAESLRPIQMALGVKRGVEKVAHLFRALWEKGFAEIALDFTNGFNDLLRQAMLDAVDRRCPELTELFNKFYAIDSLCFFIIDGEVRVILGEEGSRMGCVLGSFGFDLTVQDIFEAVLAKVPAGIFKALTDDFNAAVPPASSLQEQLRDCATVFTTTRDEAKRIAGLSLNMDKSGVLLPLDADGSVVDIESISLPDNFPSDLKILNTGLKVGGAPIGTDDFVREFTRDCLNHFEQRLSALPGIDPQTGIGLLRVCVASAPIFLAQVTPPLLTHDLFLDFDEKMQECALQLATLPGQDPPYCSVERLARAKQRLQLPIRHKGAGILSVARRHAIAYFSSVVSSSVAEDQLAAHLDGLTRFGADTHARLLTVVGPVCSTSEPVENLLHRSNANPMLDISHYVDIFLEQPDLKMQKELSRAAHAHAATVAMGELQGKAGDMATSDLIAACSRDRSAVVLVAKLSDHYNRLQPHEFVCWFRRFLQLPPLQRLGNAATRPGYDYDMERCKGEHATGDDLWLDAYGSHDNSNCLPTMQGKHRGHTTLKWTLHRFARLVPGVESKVEPRTDEILLNQFSEAQCRKLFPKQPSNKRAEQVQAIVDELDEIKKLPLGEERDRRCRGATSRMDALNANYTNEEKKAVRLDNYFRHGTDELLIDGTIVHSMTKSAVAKEAARTWERILSDVKEVKGKPAAAIETARAKKYKTYNPLLYVIKKQVIDGRRRKEPQFSPLVMTTFGELGPGCAVAQEWLAMRYRASLEQAGPRADGVKVTQLVGEFRTQFRIALMMVAIRRAAAMQQASGLPEICTKKNILEAAIIGSD